jgi:hypothetical protein
VCSHLFFHFYFLLIPSSRYEAAEENEISFQEGDRIEEIETVSDEWWQGKDPQGNVGLFPGSHILSHVFIGEKLMISER